MIKKVTSFDIDLKSFKESVNVWRKLWYIVNSFLNFFIYFLCGQVESLFNIFSRFRGCFQKHEPVFLSESFSLLSRNLTSMLQVAFISNKHDRHILISILTGFL